MKVGLITLHSSFSYGACLQTYATCEVIKKMGHKVEIINYVNKYEQNQNHLIIYNKKLSVLRNIKNCLDNIFLNKYYNRKKAFTKFHKSFSMTSRYTDKSELDNLEYDVVISGSDQLWNPDIFGGLEDAFFLNFGKISKRISYAASAGSHYFSEEELQTIIPLLKKYTAISVREDFLQKQLSELAGISSVVVIDPTLLLSKSEWLNLRPLHMPLMDEEYILVYMIGVPYGEYKKKYAPIVRYYAEKLGVKVYAVSSASNTKYYACDKNLCTLTPEGLIHAINNAQLVITSSFHGVAFSINLNKEFVALKTANPLRVDNLLKITGLENRLMNSFDDVVCEKMLAKIDYEEVNVKLTRLRDTSYGWLKENLER